jgi:hypothetical protein
VIVGIRLAGASPQSSEFTAKPKKAAASVKAHPFTANTGTLIPGDAQTGAEAPLPAHERKDPGAIPAAGRLVERRPRGPTPSPERLPALLLGHAAR